MSKKRTLKDTNPYLKNPKQRDNLLRASVNTSTAVEGVHFIIPSNYKPQKR